MISNKQLQWIEVFQFIFYTALHVFYSAWTRDEATTRYVMTCSAVFSIILVLSFLLIRNAFVTQIAFIVCTMINVHLIGTRMGSLALGICLYMAAGTLISIYGDRRLNLWMFVITNIAIVMGIVLQRGVIAAQIPMKFYMMLIMTCEVHLITAYYLVAMYQKKVGEIQEQNVLLNEAQKSKSEFLANMSHEIRTPMNAIVGMSELILRDEQVGMQSKQYAHDIQAAGKNLLAIINDVLDFSKIESGKMKIMYEPYSIMEVVQDVVSMALFRRGYKEIGIIVDLSPYLPKLLNGDEVRNRQILTNIITNAVKFTEEGYIYILVTCENRAGDNWLKICVQDSGIGIKSEDMEHLYDAFERMDTKRNRSIEGTGLGLPICKQLVEAMDGTIRVESEYGKGTRVTVELPQRVIDRTPCLTLKRKEDTRILTYIDLTIRKTKVDNPYFKTAVDGMWNELKIENRLVTDFETLQAMPGLERYSHVFMGLEEYRRHREYFDELAKRQSVFVMQDPRYSVKLGEGVFGINLPLSSYSIISSMNGESFYDQINDSKSVAVAFKLPKANIMVVDDNDLNLKVAEGLIKLFGANSILVQSGRACLELLKEQDVDMIFMDHMMPELDGVETTKLIRQTAREEIRNVPIIAMTANVLNDVKELFLKNGFQDFLPKPISIKGLEEIFLHWLPRSLIVYDTDQGSDQGTDIEPIEPQQINSENTAPSQQLKGNSLENVTESVTTDSERPYVTLDVDAALENMGGQRDMYKELLEYCLELEDKRWEDIQEKFDAQDWSEYTILVHALKGGMRSLGIEELAAAAQRQELACKENRISDAASGHEPLRELYHWTHRSIEHFLETFEV